MKFTKHKTTSKPSEKPSMICKNSEIMGCSWWQWDGNYTDLSESLV